MKSKLLLLIPFSLLSILSFSQTYIKIDEKKIMQSPNLNAVRPQFNYENFKVEDYEKIKTVFEFLKESTQMQFNYPQGNCHNRAELMCMYLKKQGISNFKIWNLF